MASIGDVLELVDEQFQEGQQMLNVYYYRLDTPVVGNACEMLVDSWIDNVLPLVLDVQSVDVVHTSVRAINLFNDTEEHTELISEAGNADSAALPSFNAVAFTLIGDNAAVRNGAKRIAGLSETTTGDGSIIDASLITALTALAVQFALGLPIGLDIDALMPVIVGRILDGGSYRLPDNAGEAVLSNVIDSLFKTQITSQVSRKFGVGA